MEKGHKGDIVTVKPSILAVFIIQESGNVCKRKDSETHD